jgi:hypothetical protein
MKWDEDYFFCAWLCTAQYATMVDGRVKPTISLGTVIYCYEAWRAATAAWDLNKPSMR